MDEPEDPFDGQDWSGWARYGRGPGAKWHRVREVWVADYQWEKIPLCPGRTDPMPATTVVMDYRWDPGVDRCELCWPPGTPHPGIASDLPPRSR